jgi:hypothetical protein
MKKDISLYYRTADCFKPSLLAQKSDKYPDEVAVMISLAPSFVEIESSTDF